MDASQPVCKNDTEHLKAVIGAHLLFVYMELTHHKFYYQ